MNDELVACSCCGKLVPATDTELAFRRPDVIAALTEVERSSRCKEDDDLCVLDGEKFFVRGTIPLNVHAQADTYAIGAWAEVALTDFQKILELWSDENQVLTPAFRGTLANQIPATLHSFGCALEIKLAGPTTRPHLFVTEETCTIFAEQQQGIPLHRAGEYTAQIPSGKSRKAQKYSMVEEDGIEIDSCSCCGKAQRLYGGHISSRSDQDLIWDYWVEIPEGHEGRFCMLISLPEGNSHRVAVLSGEATDQGLSYRVLDRQDSPWNDMGEYGRIMDRNEALGEDIKSLIFELADHIATKDSRLSVHTVPYLGITT
jgi:hypothetical protein